MLSELPPSTALGFRVLYFVATLMKGHLSPVPIGRIRIEIESQMRFSEWERSPTEGGGIRWRNQLQFHSIYAMKAGLILKHRVDGWGLTERGRAVLSDEDPHRFFAAYWSERLRYRAKRSRATAGHEG